MAATWSMMTVMLLVVLHVAPVWGVTMAARDKAALVAVREAITNKELFPPIDCTYFVCDSAGRVTVVTLSEKGLKGRLAPEIGNLTKLKLLYLYLNQLSGSIPSSIGNLKSLETLWLYLNQFSGSIPSSIGKLKSLRSIILFENRLSGSIPSSIVKLTSLQSIYLYRNQLTGSIPSKIGNLKALQYLFLYNNQLSGSIPSSIKNLTSLQSFDISNNYFTGPIAQVNEHPSCSELSGNCFFGSNFPKGCDSSFQRSKSDCLSFCNATQVGGACGGKGTCTFSTDGKTSKCACNRGYCNKASKYTCK